MNVITQWGEIEALVRLHSEDLSADREQIAATHGAFCEALVFENYPEIARHESDLKVQIGSLLCRLGRLALTDRQEDLASAIVELAERELSDFDRRELLNLLLS